MENIPLVANKKNNVAIAHPRLRALMRCCPFCQWSIKLTKEVVGGFFHDTWRCDRCKGQWMQCIGLDFAVWYPDVIEKEHDDGMVG